MTFRNAPGSCGLRRCSTPQLISAAAALAEWVALLTVTREPARHLNLGLPRRGGDEEQAQWRLQWRVLAKPNGSRISRLILSLVAVITLGISDRAGRRVVLHKVDDENWRAVADVASLAEQYR